MRSQTFYHVTFLKHLASILHKPGLGLVSNRKRTWHNPFGAPLGKQDHIYAFADRMEAVLWAGKQMFDFEEPCAVIEFTDDGNAWRPEEGTIHYEHGVLCWQHHITPDQFRAIFVITHRDVRLATQERSARHAQSTQAKEAPTS